MSFRVYVQVSAVVVAERAIGRRLGTSAAGASLLLDLVELDSWRGTCEREEMEKKGREERKTARTRETPGEGNARRAE